MPETRFNEFPALSVDPRLGLSPFASDKHGSVPPSLFETIFMRIRGTTITRGFFADSFICLSCMISYQDGIQTYFFLCFNVELAFPQTHITYCDTLLLSTLRRVIKDKSKIVIVISECMIVRLENKIKLLVMLVKKSDESRIKADLIFLWPLMIYLAHCHFEGVKIWKANNT